MKRARARLSAAWLNLEEPRWVTACQITVYVVAVGICITTIIRPPTSLVEAWGDELTTGWGLIMGAGGLLGAVGCSRGIWWLEARAIGLLTLGVALRIVLVGALHLAEPGSRLVQWLELTIVLLYLVIRWLRIRDFPRDPTRDRHRAPTHH